MTIVSLVLGDCPECKRTACFGNSQIRGTTLFRGCKHCAYKQKIALPHLTKKIIYLDQSLLSAAFMQRDDRAVQAVDLVSELASDQLLVAPYSNVHEDETYQWNGYNGRTAPELMNFIKRSARGLKFKPTFDIEHCQIVRAFKGFRAKIPTAGNVVRTDALVNRIDVWQDYMYVTQSNYYGNKDLIRQNKEHAVNSLLTLFGDWKKTKKSFDDNLAIAIIDLGQSYFNEFENYCDRIARDELDALHDSSAKSQSLRALIRDLPDGIGNDEKIQEIERFFKSPYFASVPWVLMTARIFSKLNVMVQREGTYENSEKAKKKLTGFVLDVAAIATYSPYCDAIFVDNVMCSMITDLKVGIEKSFATKVFCMNTIDEFCLWLRDIKMSMTDAHRNALNIAYGRQIK